MFSATILDSSADPHEGRPGAGDPPRDLQRLTRPQDRIPTGMLNDLFQSLHSEDGSHGHIKPPRLAKHIRFPLLPPVAPHTGLGKS
jgi:hypothetical protein